MSLAPFIIIDDESLIVETLAKIIGKAFPNSPIHKCDNGFDGLNVIRNNAQNKPIVICDIVMPGMNGIQVLQKVREDDKISHTYFIILTSNHDNDLNLKTLQRGADDLLYKPFNMDDLLARLRLAARIVNLNNKISENQLIIDEMVENEFLLVKDLINGILAKNIPDIHERTENIANAAKWIALEYGDIDEKEVKNIQRASYLCYTGMLSLEDSLQNNLVMKDGFATSGKMMSVSEYAYQSLSKFEILKDTAEIVKYIYENYDGTGFPDRLQKWQINKGSRIIRVVKDFFELSMTIQPQNKVIEYLFEHIHRIYDQNAIAFLDQYLATHKPALNKVEKRIDLEQLEPEMIISRNILTKLGLVLIPRNYVMSKELIQKIKQTAAKEGIIGNIYIFDNIKKEETPHELNTFL